MATHEHYDRKFLGATRIPVELKDELYGRESVLKQGILKELPSARFQQEGSVLNVIFRRPISYEEARTRVSKAVTRLIRSQGDYRASA